MPITVGHDPSMAVVGQAAAAAGKGRYDERRRKEAQEQAQFAAQMNQRAAQINQEAMQNAQRMRLAYAQAGDESALRWAGMDRQYAAMDQEAGLKQQALEQQRELADQRQQGYADLRESREQQAEANRQNELEKIELRFNLQEKRELDRLQSAIGAVEQGVRTGQHSAQGAQKTIESLYKQMQGVRQSAQRRTELGVQDPREPVALAEEFHASVHKDEEGVLWAKQKDGTFKVARDPKEGMKPADLSKLYDDTRRALTTSDPNNPGKDVYPSDDKVEAEVLRKVGVIQKISKQLQGGGGGEEDATVPKIPEEMESALSPVKALADDKDLPAEVRQVARQWIKDAVRYGPMEDGAPDAVRERFDKNYKIIERHLSKEGREQWKGEREWRNTWDQHSRVFLEARKANPDKAEEIAVPARLLYQYRDTDNMPPEARAQYLKATQALGLMSDMRVERPKKRLGKADNDGWKVTPGEQIMREAGLPQPATAAAARGAEYGPPSSAAPHKAMANRLRQVAQQESATTGKDVGRRINLIAGYVEQKSLSAMDDNELADLAKLTVADARRLPPTLLKEIRDEIERRKSSTPAKKTLRKATPDDGGNWGAMGSYSDPGHQGAEGPHGEHFTAAEGPPGQSDPTAASPGQRPRLRDAEYTAAADPTAANPGQRPALREPSDPLESNKRPRLREPSDPLESNKRPALRGTEQFEKEYAWLLDPDAPRPRRRLRGTE